jgi:hypothetical protein
MIICDGMGDRADRAREFQTPLSVAKKPHVDALARDGSVGLVDPVAPGVRPGSDVAVACAHNLATIDGHNLTFRIYGEESGGTALWSESKVVLADSLGVFSTILGSDQAISLEMDSQGNCVLGVHIATSAISLRKGPVR